MRPAPGRGPRPGPPIRGGPDTAPWGLTASTAQGGQADSAEVSNEAEPLPALGNRGQARRGRSHDPLAKRSLRTNPLPWARKTQCYQVTTLPGNNLLM